MLISQDVVRRDILKVKDGCDTKALPLMKELLVYGNNNCDIVILEGIMYSDWYKPLFQLAIAQFDKIFPITMICHLKKHYPDIRQK